MGRTMIPIIWMGVVDDVVERLRRALGPLTTGMPPIGCSSPESGICTVLEEYATHYNSGPAHRSLERPETIHIDASGPTDRIRRRPILGGLISQYESATTPGKSLAQPQVRPRGRLLNPTRIGHRTTPVRSAGRSLTPSTPTSRSSGATGWRPSPRIHPGRMR